jgi:hypothetical protein
VKYEEVYLHAYETGAQARTGLGTYFEYYNTRRRHQGLDGLTPTRPIINTSGYRKPHDNPAPHHLPAAADCPTRGVHFRATCRSRPKDGAFSTGSRRLSMALGRTPDAGIPDPNFFVRWRIHGGSSRARRAGTAGPRCRHRRAGPGRAVHRVAGFLASWVGLHYLLRAAGR